MLCAQDICGAEGASCQLIVYVYIYLNGRLILLWKPLEMHKQL